MRTGISPGVCAAGTIASSQGSPSDAPVPRNRVRRDIENLRISPILPSRSVLHPQLGIRPGMIAERNAGYDPLNQDLSLITVGFELSDNTVDGTVVFKSQTSTKSVSEHLTGQVADKEVPPGNQHPF